MFLFVHFRAIAKAVLEYVRQNLSFKTPKCKALLELVKDVRPEALDVDNVRLRLRGEVDYVRKMRGNSASRVLRCV